MRPLGSSALWSLRLHSWFSAERIHRAVWVNHRYWFTTWRCEAPIREVAAAAIWQIWSRSGDAAIDKLFARGLAQMQAQAFDQALATFNEIVRRKPGVRRRLEQARDAVLHARRTREVAA